MRKKPYSDTFFAKVIPDLNKVIDASIYIYMAFVFVFSLNKDTDIKKYSNAFAVVLMVLIGIYVLTNHFEGIINRFSLLYGLFTAYCLLSILWSADRSITIERSTTVLKLFVMCSLLFYYTVHEKKSDLLLNAVYIGGLCCLAFTVIYYGPEEFIKGMYAGIRMGGEFTNQNALGSALTTTAVIGYYYAFYEKKWWNFFPASLTALVAIGPVSRIAILMFVTGVFSLFFFFATGKKRVVCILLFFCLAALGVFLVLQLPILSSVKERFILMVEQLLGKSGSDVSTEIRMGMITKGVEQFLKTPLLGSGLGTSNVIMGMDTYLHNNYIEMLACTGIIGFILYYSIYCYIFVKSIKPAFKRNNNAVIVITLLLMLLTKHIGAVEYYGKITTILITYMLSTITEHEKEF